MKVKRVEPTIESSFKPVTIQLTFETENELIAFYMVFNHTFILEADGIEGILNSSKIKEALGHVNYGGKWPNFAKSLDKRFYENRNFK
jgi:hypothetical protein